MSITHENKVAIITGASRGIGLGIAKRLVADGARVVITARQPEALAEAVEALGGPAHALAIAGHADDASHQAEVVAAARETFGRLDYLVNNAGINPTYAYDRIGLAEWNRTLHTNLTSAFLCSQAVIPGMKKRRWGRLIMLSSIAAQTGGVIGPHYAASKAGILGLVHSFANLLARDGITANAIAPALIETDMIRNNDKINPELIPIGRFGHAEEVARIAVMLSENGYITGQTINVNGGWYMS